MINRAILVGRLTRDPDLRYTSSGAAVATFTIAVNRQFTNQQGEREADFINCVIWRKAAENFANFTHKGSLVGVEGRIQTRSYENQQGNRVYVTEVIVDSFSLLESRSQSERQQGSSNSQSSSPSQGTKSNSGDNPFGNVMNNNNNSSNNTNDADPFASNGQQIDISDDDLPF
ncbi:MAG: single-stranded DNA-binding protein [Liquorilactobacillus hordei]|uniref:Single-stranded DNA-binding protein n=2 Tax=Liquorilactobacillus hordei TaxID=468911 RepID=A0A0R1MMG6_9LACO|nr:single-stranded DNA-binding protein [Liquorilactobacillus hordei]AUJ28745.1 single-stranded DNA-binding protein [Liquorilactobacillus hordei]KRL06346.1 single-strand DNA binding protein [Liquorilactobacillus hordei DSM 19519]MBZ2406105.1 single-stranded DNA-binding protein [Liquorilactobacillus hordei]QYH51456.1 single-stranded DNA-binding protein [Liquorilactobacillus hordei DSM 19519]